MIKIHCDQKPYKFCLESNYAYNFPVDIDSPIPLRDKHGRCWGVLHKDGIVIYSGYAWDGCTPKICVYGHLIGVPDGLTSLDTGKPSAYYASLVHDILCQFYHQIPLKMSRIDEIFYMILKRDGFILKDLYYIAVRAFHLLNCED